jgi:hypothetical protein
MYFQEDPLFPINNILFDRKRMKHYNKQYNKQLKKWSFLLPPFELEVQKPQTKIDEVITYDRNTGVPISIQKRDDLYIESDSLPLSRNLTKRSFIRDLISANYNGVIVDDNPFFAPRLAQVQAQAQVPTQVQANKDMANSDWVYVKDDRFPDADEYVLKQNSTNILFSGSGILLVENGNPETVLLIQSKSGMIEEMGGSIDKNAFPIPNMYVLMLNAIKELQEESQGLFKIDVNTLNIALFNNYVDIIKDKYTYRCYIICINTNDINVLQQKFNSNKQYLSNNSNYNESKALLRFQTSQIKKNSSVNTYIIRQRTRDLFSNADFDKIKNSSKTNMKTIQIV